jgi:hypothetical protein
MVCFLSQLFQPSPIFVGNRKSKWMLIVASSESCSDTLPEIKHSSVFRYGLDDKLKKLYSIDRWADKMSQQNDNLEANSMTGYDILSTCHFVNLSFCQLVILSTWNFVNLKFCQLVILSTCHFDIRSTCHQVNLSLGQLVIWSTCHLVNLSFGQLVILSTCHFVNLSFCQLVILSTCHFVNLSFCQLVILWQIDKMTSSHNGKLI